MTPYEAIQALQELNRQSSAGEIESDIYSYEVAHLTSILANAIGPDTEYIAKFNQ